MSSEIRTYQLKARAASQRETRARIAACAAELHLEKGVAQTTVSEIARRAGVTRVTVYSHFPDLSALLPACSAHYEAQHPAPDFAPALATESPAERVRTTLELLYGWYDEVSPMFTKVLADRVTVPELDAMLSEGLDRLQAGLSHDLAAGYPGSTDAEELVRLAVDFWTWRRLAAGALDASSAAALMSRAVDACGDVTG